MFLKPHVIVNTSNNVIYVSSTNACISHMEDDGEEVNSYKKKSPIKTKTK